MSYVENDALFSCDIGSRCHFKLLYKRTQDNETEGRDLK